MNIRSNFLVRAVLLSCLAVVVVGVTAAAMPRVRGWLKAAPPAPATPDDSGPVQLVDGKPNTFTLAPSVVRAMGIATTAAAPASHPRLMHMNGNLSLDPARIVRVRSFFAGEVKEIGTVEAPADAPAITSLETRPLRFGDKVQKGQLLAVIWSKELGEKKNELMDALVQFRLDSQGLKAKEEFARSLSEQTLREARVKVAQERLAADRAERTLRIWQVSEPEIAAVKQEAETILKNETRDPQRTKDWARAEVRARSAGKVLELNCSVGDNVDATTVLFTVADLSRLVVVANAYEEDLAALQNLTPEQKQWTIRLQADPSRTFRGAITTIGDIIDPNQRTVPVMGFVDNADWTLRSAQWVTAELKLPPPANEAEVPPSAVVEDGAGSYVIVRGGDDPPHYTLRRVAVARRVEQFVCLRNDLRADERAQGMQPVRPGEQVVSSGVLELAAALKDLQSNAHK